MSSIYKPCSESSKFTNLKNPEFLYPQAYTSHTKNLFQIHGTNNKANDEEKVYGFKTNISYDGQTDEEEGNSSTEKLKPYKDFDQTGTFNLKSVAGHTFERCSATLLFKICVIIVLIAAGSIIIGFVVTCVFLPLLMDPVQPAVNAHAPQKNYLDLDDSEFVYNSNYLSKSKQLKADDVITVKSSLNLHEISAATSVVKISRLTDSITPLTIALSSTKPSVKELHLLGPITQSWLHQLLSCFSDLKTIVVDIDKVCEGFDSERQPKLSEIRLKNLERFTIENSFKCPILQWGFDIKTPNLKIVEVSKAILTGKYYSVFEKILNETSHTIEGIEITKSYLCDDCDITEMEFENLRYLKITKRLDRDPRHIFAESK